MDAAPLAESILIDGQECPELDQLEAHASLPSLPPDCAFGDAGAHELMEQPQTEASAESAEAKAKAKTTKVQIETGDTFDTVLASKRTFHLPGGCVVRIDDSITPDSMNVVATVYKNDLLEEKVGAITTAKPLSVTTGLKAVCSRKEHVLKRGKQCSCWLELPKRVCRNPSSTQRFELFTALAHWLEDGLTKDREAHLQDSWTLRVAAGMNPRSSR